MPSPPYILTVWETVFDDCGYSRFADSLPFNESNPKIQTVLRANFIYVKRTVLHTVVKQRLVFALCFYHERKEQASIL